ncbi:MAG: pyrroloquinoline quinone precursor peptide PqqA [Gammaproteobacteria bacterium]
MYITTCSEGLLTSGATVYTQHASILDNTPGGPRMKWETPKYDDIRFGFEVTMYINNR